MAKILITDILSKLKWQISNSSAFNWQCFGSNARCIDLQSINNSWYIHVVFDVNTTEVRYVTVSGKILSLVSDRPVLWVDADFAINYVNEASFRNVEYDKAYDHVYYDFITDQDKLLSILDMIVAGEG